MSERTPITTAVATAALVLSKEYLANEDAARAAVNDLDDGTELINLASRMYSLPMVAKHLNHLKPDWFDPDVTKPMDIQFRLAHLVLRAEQEAFYRDCIAPVGCGHAFIKGFALADQFYDEPSIRYARDIDVLVRRHALNDVIGHAREKGYTLLDIVDIPNILESEQDVRAALRYQQVISLISPKGCHIEVHREVDKEQGIFDERQLLFTSAVIDGNEGAFETLNPIDHFIYVAYHCARHNWSKLHWLADLSAMAASPKIPRDHLLIRAKELGLEGLIAETLGFVELSGNPAAAQPDAVGARILERVIDILKHGEQRAVELANAQTTMALPFPDMLAPWLRKRIKIRRAWGRLKPHISDYHSWPLPDRWQWLYRVAGPTRRVLRKGHS